MPVINHLLALGHVAPCPKSPHLDPPPPHRTSRNPCPPGASSQRIVGGVGGVCSWCPNLRSPPRPPRALL